MQRLPIAVIGASGYSGMEATRILAHHPSAEVRLATSDRWQGESIERRTGVRRNVVGFVLIAIAILANTLCGLVLGKFWLRNRVIRRGDPGFYLGIAAGMIALALCASALLAADH